MSPDIFTSFNNTPAAIVNPATANGPVKNAEQAAATAISTPISRVVSVIKSRRSVPEHSPSPKYSQPFLKTVPTVPTTPKVTPVLPIIPLAPLKLAIIFFG